MTKEEVARLVPGVPDGRVAQRARGLRSIDGGHAQSQQPEHLVAREDVAVGVEDLDEGARERGGLSLTRHGGRHIARAGRHQHA